MKPRNWLDSVVGGSRYVALVAVICLIIGAAVEFGWGALHTWDVAITMYAEHKNYQSGVVGLLHLLDAFLVAISLLIIAVGIYELFISPVAVPEVMTVGSLHALKQRAVSMFILIMVVTFIEHLMAWEDGHATLLHAIAIAIITLALLVYTRLAGPEKEVRPPLERSADGEQASNE